MEIYHGSNMIVREPRILERGFYKDFGFGFYCTSLKKQAIKWAKSRGPKHIVNVYEYQENPALRIRRFHEMSDEWLDFIGACRNGEKHNFDIVEGPMADDTIWDYVEDYMEGKISREAFWVLAKFKYPTHQILFCTKEALETIQFVRSEEQ